MASSGKFDLSSSSSPIRPLYNSSKRGSHTSASMDRSSSFRDNIENPILSSLPSMPRTTVNVTQVEVTNFFQCLRFDLKSMATEYKCNRFGDYKRLASAALCGQDDSPSGLLKGKFPSSTPEDMKRLKVGLRESTIKARERVKIFSDVLSVMNKCFPSIPSRKRSRPDTFSVNKMSTQTHSPFDYEKVEERGKNVIPNKRTRTSMTDVRPNTPARSSGSIEERSLPIVPDGWEKAKMKKKRTGIKPDSALSTTKPIDGIRDSRPGVHPRNLLEARPRLSDFRQGAVNGVGKTDSIPMHISGSPSSTTKLHQAPRGPRTGTGGVVPKLPHGQRSTVSNGMESESNKSPGGSGISSTNRKRTPVTQWADRRPQKISRTARRTNLVPVVSNDDDVASLGNSEVVSVSEKRRGFAKRFPKQFKSKVDHTLSESEESGAGENSGLNDQKMLNLVPPTRKNKFMSNVGTVKQLKSGRIGVDKPESKLGRPPTRKLSGRKAYMRQKHSVITAPTDFLVGSDDGHGELLAAANAVINPAYALSNPFWRKMEQLFGFVSDADVAYIKQEGSILSSFNTLDNCDMYSNGSYEPQKTETESEYESSDQLMSGTSLCQRLLSALITEDNEYTWHGNDVYESAFESETDSEFNSVNHRSFQSFDFGQSFSSSYRIDESPLRSCNEGLFTEPSSLTCSQYQYGNMSINQRLLMEIHSLGLYPLTVPDLVQSGDEDVSIDIRRMEEKHRQQVSKKETLLNKLLNSTEKARKLHEKEFEQLSLEKLTRITYHNYMNCWGKGINGKMAKQAALENVKRTLDRVHEFETTGKSCFSDPLFKDMLISGLNNDKTQQSPPLTSFDFHQNNFPGQTTGEDDVWSISRGKKRELHLDDVAGTSKGKRSEREKEKEREGKGNGNGNGIRNGERKNNKTKIKQKTTPASPIPTPIPIPVPDPIENESVLLEEPLDLSHLQLPDMDEFDVGQGQDIGSWLNIGDEVLHDDDFMGLEIPMDDLTDLNMMV